MSEAFSLDAHVAAAQNRLAAAVAASAEEHKAQSWLSFIRAYVRMQMRWYIQDNADAWIDAFLKESQGSAQEITP